MKLWPDSYEAIKSKTKTIEMRLNDEMRSLVKVGDKIKFINTSSKEEILCSVTNIFHYQTFEELYEHHDKISIGYAEEENADPKDMLNYYSSENIFKYGVISIELESN